jgi:hypothetical protein
LSANWEQVRYYLPDYHVIAFPAAQSWADVPAAAEPTAADEWTVPAGGMAVILFDPTLAPFDATPDQTHSVALAGGDTLTYFDLSAGQRFLLAAYSFGVID